MKVDKMITWAAFGQAQNFIPRNEKVSPECSVVPVAVTAFLSDPFTYGLFPGAELWRHVRAGIILVPVHITDPAGDILEK
jgi:hypothetical protein